MWETIQTNTLWATVAGGLIVAAIVAVVPPLRRRAARAAAAFVAWTKRAAGRYAGPQRPAPTLHPVRPRVVVWLSDEKPRLELRNEGHGEAYNVRLEPTDASVAIPGGPASWDYLGPGQGVEVYFRRNPTGGYYMHNDWEALMVWQDGNSVSHSQLLELDAAAQLYVQAIWKGSDPEEVLRRASGSA